MKMTNQEYGEYVNRKSPPSPMLLNMVKAFIIGGIICCIGQIILGVYKNLGLDEMGASAAASVTLIFAGVLLTSVHVYDKIAKFAGAGTLVPITGFANSVAAPALEFRTEGIITGMSAKMFVIAGPVLVFGVTASAIYGVIYYVIK